MKKLAFYAGVGLGFSGVILLVLCMGWIIFDKELFQVFSKIDDGKASNIGQFIGGLVGVFLSGAGFFLIYSTFQVQKEFNDNQDSFNKEQLKYFQEQNKLFDKQQFESSFFNLLSAFNDMACSTTGEVPIKVKDGFITNTILKSCKGREFFSAVLHKLKDSNTVGFVETIIGDDSIQEINSFHKNNRGTTAYDFIVSQVGNNLPLSLGYSVRLYEFVYNDYQNQLGHYYRFLFNIVKFCIAERKEKGDVKRYINIIQAQIPNDELGLIFYNVLSNNARTSNGTLKFHNWLDYFDFFQNIDSGSLLNREHHEFYSTIFKFLNDEEIGAKTVANPKPKLIFP